MRWNIRGYSKRDLYKIQTPRYVLYNMIDHSVRMTDDLYEEENEAILIRDYPILHVLSYIGTCTACQKPVNITREFFAALASEDEKKHTKLILPVAWFNCPHCQTTLSLMQIWEKKE